MVHGDGRVKRRERQRQKHRRPADDAQSRGHDVVLALLLRNAQKFGKRDRHEKGDRYAVDDKPDAPV